MINNYELLKTNEKLMLGAIVYEYWNDGKILNESKKFRPKEVGFINCHEVSYYLYIMSNFIIGSQIEKRPYPIIENVILTGKLKEIVEDFKESNFEKKLEFISYFSKDFYDSDEFRKINLFKNLTEDYSFLDIHKNIETYLKTINEN